MKPLCLFSALALTLGCRSAQLATQPVEPAYASTVGAVRSGDVVVTTKIEERGDAIFELLVEIERVHENGSREVLGTPRVLLSSGQNAELQGKDGDNMFSVQASFPATGRPEDALIDVSMLEGTQRTSVPRIHMPMPTVTRTTEDLPAPDSARVVSVAFLEEDVHTVIASIAHQAEKNIVVTDRIQGKVTLNVRDVSWYRALQLALEPLALRATTEGGDDDLLYIDRSPTVTQHCQVWLNFVDEDFARVVAAIAEQAHINVIADAGIGGNLTLRAEGVSWLTALETAAEAVGCVIHVSPDGTIVRIVPA